MFSRNTHKSILTELNQTADGRGVVKRLRGEHFPFAVPTAFMGKESSPDTDVVVAPVLEGENATRFRLDLIQTGFDQMPELWTSAKEWAVQRFYELATCGRRTLTLQLNSGDILFGHNRNILRARTPFDDAQRLLIRIRMSRANTP